MDTLGVGSEKALFSIKITTIAEIVHLSPRASQMTARASKIIKKLVTLLVTNKTLEVKKTRKSKQTKK